MELINIFVFCVLLKFSTGALVSESQQIALEVSNELLPPSKLSIKIKEQLRAIRHLYPMVSNIKHAAAWVPGEVVVLQDELNSNIGVIKAINESQYGPLLPVVSSASKADSPNEVVLSFERPYNGEIFSQQLQNEFKITTRPNYIKYDTRNEITFVNSAPTYSTYTIKKSWRFDGGEKVLSHYWEFTVAPADTFTVKLEREYGDEL